MGEIKREIERMRERNRDRERETERQRQTDRQTDRDRDRDIVCGGRRKRNQVNLYGNYQVNLCGCYFGN